MKTKISIVGGSGFLGTRLANRFLKEKVNYNIIDICEEKNSNSYGDVEDINSLNILKDSCAIINLAAMHRDDVRPISRYDDVNVGGAINICEAARRFDITKIVFTSSVAIYGFAPLGTDEDGEPNYFNDYGRTKYEAELIYKAWLEEDPKNRTLVIIRPTVIFGEGNRGNVFNLLNQINNKKFLMIGNGKNYKSMAYVENVAAFIEHSLNFKEGMHTYNYIDKPDFNMNDLIKEIRKKLFNKDNVGFRVPLFFGLLVGYLADFLAIVSRKSLPISSIRVKKFISNSRFSTSIEKIDFTPPVTLKEGLQRTLKYEFLEDNLDKKTFYSE
jgi:GlcNAc-P-P-Und epimerase